MSYAETFLPEFDQEMANTRKVLERISDDKMDWQAHSKSHTIGWNANHVADMPSWIVMVLTRPSLDIAPVDGPAHSTPKLAGDREIVAMFDRNVAAARKAIAGARDKELGDTWALLKGGEPVISLPRAAMIRSFVLNHIIHHRAILCVYLRLNDIPVPGMYGPSGDE